jgi:FkbM family methyltransferase
MSLCFDIGANRGLYTDANQKFFSKFLLVEPNINLFNFLTSKYKLNSNITVLNKIVSNLESETFYLCEKGDTISTCDPDWVNKSRFSNNYKWVEEKNIPTISLDKCIETYGKPDRIKIDVEGYELNVLKSLTKKVDELCFEWAEEKLDDIFESLEYLKSVGFLNFAIQLEDKYDYYPQNFYDIQTIITWFKTNCNKERKNLWGMIWCT